MKKCIASLICAFALVGIASAGGAYSVISVPAPGLWTPPIQGVAKIAQVKVTGSTVDTGTVILSSVSKDKVCTNQLFSVTCSDGAVTHTETNTTFIVAGETLLRSGTATNGTCMVIVAQ